LGELVEKHAAETFADERDPRIAFEAQKAPFFDSAWWIIERNL